MGSGGIFASGGIFDRVADRALGVFDRVADLELGELELELAHQYRVMGFQSQQAAAPLGSDLNPVGLPWATIATVALLGGAGFVAYKYFA